MKAMKGLFLFLTIPVLAACNNSGLKYDASGVFETTSVLVSAQATGQLMQFDLEEGQPINPSKTIGYIDTMQLYLKKKQLLVNKDLIKSREVNIPLQVATTKQQIETLQKEFERFQSLVESNAANQKQVDDIQGQIQLLQKQLDAQEETYEKTNQGVSAQSSDLDVQIAQLNDQIKKSIIKSPSNGTILSKYAQQGELAQPGKALFKFADVKLMFLRAYITASQLTQIKINQNVKVYTDFGENTSKEYNGKVSWISDKSEFTPKTIQTRDIRANMVYAVKVAVINDGFIKEGMYGEVKL